MEATDAPAGLPPVPARRRIRSFPRRASLDEALRALHAGDRAACEAALGRELLKRSGGVVPVGRVPRTPPAAVPRLAAWEAPEDAAWTLLEAAWVRLRLGGHEEALALLQRCHEDLDALHGPRA